VSWLDQVDAERVTQVVTILAVGFGLYWAVLVATAQLKRISYLGASAEARTFREKRAETLRSILNNLARVMLIAFVGATLLSAIGVDIRPIIAGAGVVGIAVGFGAQSVVKDLLAGFFIIFENQFGIGDTVTIGTYTGSVEHMTLRVTVLRDEAGVVHIIPNGKVETVSIVSREWGRGNVDFTVPYDEDLSRVLDTVGAECAGFAADHEAELVDGPDVLGVESLGPLGPTVKVTFKTKTGKNVPLARELRRRIKTAFDRAGLRFATSADEAPTKS
jgi:moderate conductance mechanosensitive channel